MCSQKLCEEEIVRTYDQEPSEEEMVEAVYMFAAEQMQSGASETQIKAMLIHKGLDPESAGIVVSNLTRMRSEAGRAAGRKNMLHGSLWFIGGTIVTLVTYIAASGGGTYVIAWGAVIFGAIQFLRGLVQWFRN
jgi:hypothetical protein